MGDWDSKTKLIKVSCYFRDEWQGHIPPYIPEFYDGWQPAAAVIDELASRAAIMGATPLPMIEPAPARIQPAIEDRQRGYVCVNLVFI